MNEAYQCKFECFQLLKRSEAKTLGLDRYFTARPCKHGHVSERVTTSGVCVECEAIRSKRRGDKPEYKDYKRSHRLRYVAQNREKVRASNKTSRLKNPDHYRTYKREWRRKNKEKAFAEVRNRLARKRDADGFFTASDIASIRNLQVDKCAVCKCKLNNRGTVDHIIPLKVGGSNWPSNLQLLCVSCNCSKGAKLPEEFMRSRGFLL